MVLTLCVLPACGLVLDLDEDGTVDGGLDAGQVDASILDGSSGDTSAADGSATDAGRVDASVSDAGHSDGGGAGADAGCIPPGIVVEDVAYSDLVVKHAVCDGTGEAWGPHCNAAISRYCMVDVCTDSGFGPVEPPTATARIACVPATRITITYADASPYDATCDGAMQRWGFECSRAIDGYCVAMGFTSGFGPVENIRDELTVSCVGDSVALRGSVPYTTLSMHVPQCNGVTQRWGLECAIAVHRYCVAMGATSGFGPVDAERLSATVVCVGP